MHFRLYVRGNTTLGMQAQSNFLALANQHFPGHYELEVVNLDEEPLRALKDGVFLTPTLIRYSEPVRRILGNLSEADRVLMALEPTKPRP